MASSYKDLDGRTIAANDRELERLVQAAFSLFMQMYGVKKYGSHGPTVAQVSMLGGALKDCGVALPDDYFDVFLGEKK